jgi:hypothetical protein
MRLDAQFSATTTKGIGDNEYTVGQDCGHE